MEITSITKDYLYNGAIIICQNCQGTGLMYLHLDDVAISKRYSWKRDTCDCCGGAGRVKIRFERLSGFKKPEEKEAGGGKDK